MEKGKFLNSLVFKHFVLTLNDEELIETLSTQEEPLQVLLDITEDAYEVDPKFFSLDKSITEKGFNCLNHYRFDPNYRTGYTDRINEIISNLNVFDKMNSSERQNNYNRYLNLQRYLRKILSVVKYLILWDCLQMEFVLIYL